MPKDEIEERINVVTAAQRASQSRYLKSVDFEKYCLANRVSASVQVLEAYSRKGLLVPCAAVLWPAELLRRFRVWLRQGKPQGGLEIRPEWDWFERFGQGYNCEVDDEPEKVSEIGLGHPLDRALAGEFSHTIVRPDSHERRRWGAYKVTVEVVEGHRVRQNRLAIYYAPWKIFVIDDLNRWNSEESLLVLDSPKQRRFRRALQTWQINSAFNWACYSRDIKPGFSKLLGDELPQRCLLPSPVLVWEAWFNLCAGYIWRRRVFYSSWRRPSTTVAPRNDDDFSELVREMVRGSGLDQLYEDGVSFLRALLSMDEGYTKRERYLLRMELRVYIAAASQLLCIAYGKTFSGIVADCEGPYHGERSANGVVAGQSISIGYLTKILPSMEDLLDDEVRFAFLHTIGEFSRELPLAERLPVGTAEALYADLRVAPEISALYPLLKIQRAFEGRVRHGQATELWDGIRLLAVRVEDYGRQRCAVPPEIAAQASEHDNSLSYARLMGVVKWS